MEDFDCISMLPLDVRAKILSLLPTQSAGRTTLLSKDWEGSWKLVNNLYIDDDHLLHQADHINFVLEALRQNRLEKLSLYVTRTLFSPSKVWMDAAISHHIAEIDFNVNDIEVPPAFFTCETIVKLKFRFLRWVPEVWDQPLWDPHMKISLPSLQYLDTSAQCDISHNVFRLINGSFALKRLSLFSCGYVTNVPPLFRLSSLKKLEFKESVEDGLVTVFYMLEHCPNLECLSFERLDQSLWTVDTLPPKCLVESLVCLEFTHFDGVDELAFEFLCYVMLKARRLKEVVITFVSEPDVQLLQPVLDRLYKVTCAVRLPMLIAMLDGLLYLFFL